MARPTTGVPLGDDREAWRDIAGATAAHDGRGCGAPHQRRRLRPNPSERRRAAATGVSTSRGCPDPARNAAYRNEVRRRGSHPAGATNRISHTPARTLRRPAATSPAPSPAPAGPPHRPAQSPARCPAAPAQNPQCSTLPGAMPPRRPPAPDPPTATALNTGEPSKTSGDQRPSGHISTRHSRSGAVIDACSTSTGPVPAVRCLQHQRGMLPCLRDLRGQHRWIVVDPLGQVETVRSCDADLHRVSAVQCAPVS